ncbi:MAG: DUF3592 domain-containing protein [Roseburia sp.]
MRQSNSKNKSILGFCIIGSIFWIIGVPLLFMGYKNIRYMKEFTQQGNQTIATITDVHEYEVSDGDGGYDDERDVYVTYMAAGEKYDSVIEEASIYGSVGEQIEIYYASDDPTVIMCPDDINSKISFLIPAGVITNALPFLMLIGGNIISKRKNLS